MSLPQALGPIGAMFGGLAAGMAVDTVGRKSALLMSAIPSLIGWLSLTSAHACNNPASFKALLLLGRFFSGCVLGWGMLCAPVSSILACSITHNFFYVV